MTFCRVVQDLFTEARNHQPSIVVIDEFESCKLSEVGGDTDQTTVDEINRQLEGTETYFWIFW